MSAVNDIIDNLIQALSLGTRGVLSDLCELEAPAENGVFISRDGGCMTLFRVEGVYNMLDTEDASDLLTGLVNDLAGYFREPGHKMEVIFESSAEARTELNQAFGPARVSARRIGVSTDPIIEDLVDRNARYCSSERVYLAFWSNAALLTGSELSNHQSRIKNSANAQPVYAQRLEHGIEELVRRHRALIERVESTFRGVGALLHRLSAREALKHQRRMINGDPVGSWEPRLPGDHPPVHIEPGENRADLSSLLYPRLGGQLFSEAAVPLPPEENTDAGRSIANIGGTRYAVGYIWLSPESPLFFQQLFDRVDRDIPWRVRFLLEGGMGGSAMDAIRTGFARVFAIVSAENRMIRDADKEAKALAEDQAIMVSWRMTWTTWADTPELLDSRRARLVSALQAWGFPEPREDIADPVEGYVATLPAVTNKSTAPSTPMPIEDAMTMLPVMRPASPWETGSVSFRTPEGKPWFYQPGSSRQATWIDMVFSGPGSGKSVLLGMLNNGLMMRPGLKRLPKICHIDIGPSQKGWVDYYRAQLPEGRKHEAMYYSVRMTGKEFVNPTDTFLGMRYPLPMDRAFLNNLMTLLCTPVSRGQAYEGTSELLDLAIDQVYDKYAEMEPKAYKTRVLPEVDEALRELGVDPEEFVEESYAWWDIVDQLFEAENYHLAIKAQRQAMPLISDFAVDIQQDDTIRSKFGNHRTESGQGLIELVSNQLSAAPRDYTLFAGPTNIDLSESRFRVIDLREVAPQGGDRANRQTTVMYMMARFIGARDFFFGDSFLDLIANLPEGYYNYHHARKVEADEDICRINYDELHRASKTGPVVLDQIDEDAREGRKDDVQVAVSSQRVQDFTDTIIDLATSTFIMGSQKKRALANLDQILGLTDAEKYVIRHQIGAPGPAGSPLLFRYELKETSGSQLLMLTIGPRSLWLATSTKEDRVVRSSVFEALGAETGLEALAKSFPSGGCKTYLERQALQQGATPEEESGEIEVDDSAVNALANQIIEQANR